MKGLKHEADALRSKARAAIFVEREYILAIECHAPGTRHIQTRKQSKQSRLSRA